MRAWPTLTLLLACTAVQAQTLKALSIEPPAPKAGEKAVVRADFAVTAAGGVNCGLRLVFSDGTPEQYHVLNQVKDVPLVVVHTFTAPGEYTVSAQPRTKLPALKCNGGDITLRVAVSPP
jgi:hypothetical protein